MLFDTPFAALLGLSITLTSVTAFPSYGSLAGLSERELDDILPQLAGVVPGKPPVPLEFNGTKLVNDQAHPWKPLRKNDIRGPCPGLNTLASHGVSLTILFSLDELRANIPILRDSTFLAMV